MEQYLECLGIPDDEAKVKVAAQFLTKDVNMRWIHKLDQILMVMVTTCSLGTI